jgi:hypothetical protein
MLEYLGLINWTRKSLYHTCKSDSRKEEEERVEGEQSSRT